MFYRSFDPWREMNRIQHEMNQLFDNPSWQKRREYPAVNVWTNSSNLLVTAELPGYDRDSVDISVTGDILRIHGSRKAPECKEDECFHRQERSYGVFNRELALPFAIDTNNIDASFRDGILSISLPRAKADIPKKIEIKAQ